jgi:hypothetical protein
MGVCWLPPPATSGGMDSGCSRWRRARGPRSDSDRGVPNHNGNKLYQAMRAAPPSSPSPALLQPPDPLTSTAVFAVRGEERPREDKGGRGTGGYDERIRCTR